MSDDQSAAPRGRINIQINGWTIALFLLCALIGFVIFGTEGQHELFLNGIDRIVGAMERLLK